MRSHYFRVGPNYGKCPYKKQKRESSSPSHLVEKPLRQLMRRA